MGVVKSIALYGAPVWYNNLRGRKGGKVLLPRAQGKLAIRMIRGYRTISFRAALTLAGMTPLDLLAKAEADVYQLVEALRNEGRTLPDSEIRELRVQAQGQARRSWKTALHASGAATKREVEVVIAHWDRWHESDKGVVLISRVTQMFNGHGCFGEFLHKIGAEVADMCNTCTGEVDSAQHVLVTCEEYAAQPTLTDVIGDDLSPTAIVGALVTGNAHRKAVIDFYEEVFTFKEEKERNRELMILARLDRKGYRATRGRRAGAAAAPR